MDPLRLEFASTLASGITKVCIENLDNNPHLKDPIKMMIGINTLQAQEVVNKIVNAFPLNFFNQQLHLKQNIQYIIATEFILFQVREDYDHEEYSHNLANFIYELAGYISQRYTF